MQRRIATTSSMAAKQIRTLDPFDNFDSDTVNRLTRMVSEGNNIILDGFDVSLNRDRNIVSIKPGYAIKDDCVINITDNLTCDGYAIKLDITDPKSWIDCIPYETLNYYDYSTEPYTRVENIVYVVLYYSYYKNPRPNISYIGLVTKEKYDSKDFCNDCIVICQLLLTDTNKIKDFIYHSNRKDISKANSIDVSYKCYDPSIWNYSKVIPSNVQDCLTYLASLLKNK